MGSEWSAYPSEAAIICDGHFGGVSLAFFGAGASRNGGVARGAGVEERRVYETAFKRAVYGDLIGADGWMVRLGRAMAGRSGCRRRRVERILEQ